MCLHTYLLKQSYGHFINCHNQYIYFISNYIKNSNMTKTNIKQPPICKNTLESMYYNRQLYKSRLLFNYIGYCNRYNLNHSICNDSFHSFRIPLQISKCINRLT